MWNRKEERGIRSEILVHCRSLWWGTKNWKNDTRLSKHIVDTHLVSLHSSWHSSQSFHHPSRQYWTPAWQRCFCFLCRLEGWRHSTSPSRLSRHRLWLSGGPSNNRRIEGGQCQMQWIVMRGPVPAPLGSFLSCRGCLGSCWGSLVRWHCLWQGIFKIEFKNILPSYDKLSDYIFLRSAKNTA